MCTRLVNTASSDSVCGSRANVYTEHMSKKKEPKDGARLVVRCSVEELLRWKSKAAPKTLSDFVRVRLEAAR